MAKHSVPKRKQSKTRTHRRYNTFQRLAQTRLMNSIKLVPCSDCGAMRKTHHACPTCGKYRGRQIVDMEKAKSKITKIKA